MARILILNGPNLNLLGTREPEVYGGDSLADIEAECRDRAGTLGLEIAFEQSNHEGVLVDLIQAAPEQADLIVINPAAFTHTSVAIRDALLGVGLPVIEVHLSNVHQREAFRKHSYVSDIAMGVIAGFGKMGYFMALDAAARHLKSS